MADKIANFEDYVKRESRKNDPEPAPAKEASIEDVIEEAMEGTIEEVIEEAKKEIEAETPKESGDDAGLKAPKEIRQETMEIQIEDPFQFLNEQEREEYILHRQQEQHRAEAEPVRRPESQDAGQESQKPKEKEPAPLAKENPERETDRPSRERDKDFGRDREDDYDDDYDEDYEEEETSRDVKIRRVIRIASVMTGIVILVFIGFIVKVKVYDRFFAPDPDEAVTVEIAIPEGFTLKNDMVVVTGASSLNLRSGPSTSSTRITEVAEGTTLKRIAVSDDDSWAFVEYEGQQLYASMRYLAVN